MSDPPAVLSRSIGWRMSRHAQQMCRVRGISVLEVLLTVVDYEQSYTCENYGRGRQVRQRGELAVVVAPENLVVITVLLRRQSSWTDEDARSRVRFVA